MWNGMGQSVPGTGMDMHSMGGGNGMGMGGDGWRERAPKPLHGFRGRFRLSAPVIDTSAA